MSASSDLTETQVNHLCMKTIVALLKPVVFFLLLCLFMAGSTVQAADVNPPDRLTYQGYLVDGNGLALATNAPKNYDVIFRVYDNQNGGVLKWSEQQTVTVDKGYFSVLLGEGSQVGSEPHASLATIFFANDASDRYVGMTVKGIGVAGADVDILPRLRMLTAPYAYLARNAINASYMVNTNNNPIVLVTGTNVSINKVNPSSALDVNGTVTATAFSGNGANLTAINAANLTTGVLDVNRVPNLDAGKITTGSLDVNRIPNLDAGKITAGSLDVARIPNLDAAKITTGTLNNSRLSTVVGRTDVAQTYTARPIMSAGMTLNQSGSLFIRGDNDPNHVLRYAATYNGISMDGPLLNGWGGGILGTSGSGFGELATVIWNSLGVTMQGQAASNPNATTAQQAAQHLTIQARDMLGTGVRLTLGMTHVNNVEYAGIIQAYSGQGATYTTLRLNPLGGSVYSNSDRNAKKDFSAIEPKQILEKLSEMPVSKWSYKGEDGIYHIGPMAQDFKAAFDLGSDDRSIALPDGAGVTMAAIQGLNQVVKEKDGEIQALKKEVGQLQDMKKELEALRSLVESMAKKQSANQ